MNDFALEPLIEPEIKDLGGFAVRRILPSPARRKVGPFVFFDHFGPVTFPPGKGIQVRPHPHIGLATVTYLFEVEILHRDSLGAADPTRRGQFDDRIVHSERAGDDFDRSARLHGIQAWMALPLEHEACDPDFVHYPAAQIPEVYVDGVPVRIVIGKAYGRQSPVMTSTRRFTSIADCQQAAYYPCRQVMPSRESI